MRCIPVHGIVAILLPIESKMGRAVDFWVVLFLNATLNNNVKYLQLYAVTSNSVATL